MKKLKKKLQGMTLVECIIAIAVMAMMATILLLLGSAIDSHSRAARQLNRKIAVEGPVAEAQNVAAAESVGSVNIEVGYGAQTITIAADAYEVYQDPSDVVTDAAGDVVTDPSNRNFKFVDVTMPAFTAAATTT